MAMTSSRESSEQPIWDGHTSGQDTSAPPLDASLAGALSDDRTSDDTTVGLAIGLILLGVAMMFMIGSFHFMIGLAGLLEEDFYVVRPGYDLEMDQAVWSWLHLIGGIVVAVTGVFLLTGATWARALAILTALASAIWSFYSIPYYPLWSITVIALNIGLLWALLCHGKELKETH
jgi:hypothetical protein